MSSVDHEYVLGTDPVEVERLGWQHRLWSDEAVALWQRAGFAPGWRVLDVGCGPGFATRDLAQLVGARGSVVGVDISRRYVEFVNRRAHDPGASEGTGAPIEAVVGDVQHIELPDASVDGAYARWVLSFTPEPERVVREVARVLRPGGTFAIQDYAGWHALYWGPRNETLDTLRRCVLSAYSEARADSYVGRRVPAMMESSGLEVVEIRPLARTARPGDALWDWPTTFFKQFLPKIVESGHMTPDEFRAWEAEWDSLTREEGAFFCTPPQVTVIGRRR